MTGVLGIQGHRGARALFPENTLEGFAAAHALGVRAFELDVGMTADGVIVVSHDPTLNPDITRDRSGAWLTARGSPINALSSRDLAAYDVGRIRPGSRTASLFPDQAPHDGARIPTLAAVLAALPDVRFTIEVKTEPPNPHLTAPPHVLADATLAVIDAAAATERVVVESFDWRVQRHIHQTRPDVTLAWLTTATTTQNARSWWDRETGGLSVPGCVAAEGGSIWAPDHHDLTHQLIQQAHAIGLLVLPWTVNQPADMQRLIAWQVDGLITDRPDVALKLWK